MAMNALRPMRIATLLCLFSRRSVSCETRTARSWSSIVRPLSAASSGGQKLDRGFSCNAEEARGAVRRGGPLSSRVVSPAPDVDWSYVGGGGRGSCSLYAGGSAGGSADSLTILLSFADALVVVVLGRGDSDTEVLLAR